MNRQEVARRAAEQVAAAFGSPTVEGGRPSTPARGASRPRSSGTRATGRAARPRRPARDPLVGMAAAAGQHVGRQEAAPHRGYRPDGTKVTAEEKLALVRKFGAGWSTPTGPAGVTASADGAGGQLPPGHVTPFGW